MRRRLLVAPVLAAALVPRAAAADDTKVCVDAAHQAQVLRDNGKLAEARTAFATCSAPACPQIVRDHCARWLTDVIELQPTIVLGARGPEGDLYQVRVALDGRELATRLDGRAISVDPGPHELSFEAPGFPVVREFVVIREGEKGRTVVARFTRPAHHEVRASGGRHRTAMVVAGAAGALGLAGFAVFGTWGKHQRDDLADTCAPTKTCAEDDVSAARTKMIVADVSLVIGAAGAGVLTALLLAPLFQDEPAAADRGAAVGVAPLDQGFLVQLQGSY